MSIYRLITLSLVWLGVNAGMTASADSIARIHFAGSKTIKADPEFHSFANFFCSTNAIALEQQTLDKLAHYPRAWIGSRASAKIGDGYPEIRPLMEDFVESEWYLEVQDSAGIAPQFALAIHLDNDRGRLWERNVSLLMAQWTGLPVKSEPGGWVLKKDLPPDSVRFTQWGDWVVLSCEQGKFPMGDELLHQIKSSQRPVPATSSWLTLDANWARLAHYFPGLQSLDLPNTSLQLTAKGGNLNWEGKLDFAKPLPACKNWQLPTNILHQPFVSFTAARGIEDWWQHQGWAQRYQMSPVPDQLYIWVNSGMPFMSYAAIPVPNASQALGHLYSVLAPPNAPAAPAGLPPNPFSFEPKVVMTNGALNFQGFPFTTPFIEGKHEANGDFLFGGLFPNPPRSKALPPEFLNRLATKDLVFYHWEITAERLKTLPQVAQLALILTQHRQLEADSLGEKWLNQVGPTLGNTTTMGIQTGPNQVSFTRQAPGGFTALELFALACWLEAPDFPECSLKQVPIRRHVHPHPPAAANPAMPLLTH